jgi:hypothetical protein
MNPRSRRQLDWSLKKFIINFILIYFKINVSPIILYFNTKQNQKPVFIVNKSVEQVSDIYKKIGFETKEDFHQPKLV